MRKARGPKGNSINVNPHLASSYVKPLHNYYEQIEQKERKPTVSLFHDQYEFLQAGDVEQFTVRAEELAYDLIEEEWEEMRLEPTWFTEGGTNLLKEALDLMYVTAQYLNVTIGPDKAKECWDALHANNMSKCTNGKLLKREDGKVLKPDGYKKLDLSELLCNTD